MPAFNILSCFRYGKNRYFPKSFLQEFNWKLLYFSDYFRHSSSSSYILSIVKLLLFWRIIFMCNLTCWKKGLIGRLLGFPWVQTDPQQQICFHSVTKRILCRRFTNLTSHNLSICLMIFLNILMIYTYHRPPIHNRQNCS